MNRCAGSLYIGIEKHFRVPHEILYPAAESLNGQLVMAVDAHKGDSFRCPECGGVFVLRKSGKEGKYSRRPHFAHLEPPDNCLPESYLHRVYKLMLANRLQQDLQDGKAIPFHWNCELCGGEHDGDFARMCKSVEVEKNLELVRPDISLLGAKGETLVAIEVVVTNAPGIDKKAYYQSNKISLVEHHLSDNSDLEKLDFKIQYPDRVMACRNRVCTQCKKEKRRVELWIITGKCVECDSSVLVAAFGKFGKIIGPEYAMGKEKELAEAEGAYIRQYKMNPPALARWVNACRRCNFMIEGTILQKKYVAPASRGEFPVRKIDLFLHCESCGSAQWENWERGWEKRVMDERRTEFENFKVIRELSRNASRNPNRK